MILEVAFLVGLPLGLGQSYYRAPGSSEPGTRNFQELTTPPPVQSADCTNSYFELITLQRLKQAYGCGNSPRKQPVTASCRASQCSQLLSSGGAARTTCGFSVLAEARQKYPDEIECLMEQTTVACGFGVYGVSVGGDRNTKKCACQVLDQQIDALMEEAQRVCPRDMVSMLCIPTMLQAITACSWPSITDTVECVERRLGNGAIKGASVPGCYLHSCNYLQHVFGHQLPMCVCDEATSHKEWRQREWFVFQNQKQDTHDVQRYEMEATRDITLTAAPGQIVLKDAEFTDFSDPQTCTRFIRCYQSGPCFNSTDGGYCPPGELFHANLNNPAENGCYPRELVDCKGVPVANDSPGKVPTCFSGNHDFSDVNVAGDDHVTGFRVFLDHEGYLGALQFQYEGVWATKWGLVAEVDPDYEIALTPTEDIVMISGETIGFESIDQHVASLNVTIIDRSNGNVWSREFGYISPGIPRRSWSLNYPLGAEPGDSCSMKYYCGGLTEGKIQVITIHWNECYNSDNPVAEQFLRSRGRSAQNSLDNNGRNVPITFNNNNNNNNNNNGRRTQFISSNSAGLG